MSEHEFKIHPEPFAAVRSGAKRAEYRDLSDRDPIRVGDALVLREYDPSEEYKWVSKSLRDRLYTGEVERVTVTHIQTGYGMPDGHAMLSFERMEVPE